MTVSGPAEVIASSDLMVVLGRGGVGKTSVSAALGLASAANLEGETLVLTIDPARRLAKALELDAAGNEPVCIADHGSGSCWAAMLDPGRAWDAMIDRATTPAQAARIKANPVFRRIADTFVHGNDYAAHGYLADALDSGRWRRVIVDTPPSQNALGFFDAPGSLEELFTSPLLDWLTASRSGPMAAATSRPFSFVADRLLGDFFGDVTEFFVLMTDALPGLLAQVAGVGTALSQPNVAFVGVAMPTVSAPPSLRALGDELDSRGLRLDAVVMNGMEPDVLLSPDVEGVVQNLVTGSDARFGEELSALLRPGAVEVDALARLAGSHRDVVRQIDVAPTVCVPRTVESPTGIRALTHMGAHIWSAAWFR